MLWRSIIDCAMVQSTCKFVVRLWIVGDKIVYFILYRLGVVYGVEMAGVSHLGGIVHHGVGVLVVVVGGAQISLLL